ncbi:IS701 family transposase [Nesterenkonia suensis]
MQRLLSSTDWDPDLVRDDLAGYFEDHLGDSEAVLILDETGFLKKGAHSAGVARQYSGTAGRIENFQIGVFLGYASTCGRALIDRELYLPRSWAEDPDRCAAAGVPSQRGFATKPELAGQMIERSLAAGISARWVTGDAVYGQPARLRRRIEDSGLHYVLAVAANQHVISPQGPIGREYRADELARELDPRRWRIRPAGHGTKGQRRYRWAIEESFQTAKGEAGLDHYQVRSYTGWYRHITLAMLAHALLSVIRAKKGGSESGSEPGSEELIALSVPEIRRLPGTLIWSSPRCPEEVLFRSRWRRRHQQQARHHHHRARGHAS